MSGAPTLALPDAVRAALASVADPSRARQQQAYMKSTMPFRGVTLPVVRRLTREALKGHPVADQSQLVAVVRELWDDAGYREERYAALAVLHAPRHRSWRDLSMLPLYEHLVITGRWWDLVDDVATHALGELLRRRPADVAPVMRRWASDPDLWRRRAALVCQVGAKDDTDVDLLSDVIEAAADGRDFFVRKGIGWALRDYARTDPEWVRRFVDDHAGVLSPLSVREATKHLA